MRAQRLRYGSLSGSVIRGIDVFLKMRLMYGASVVMRNAFGDDKFLTRLELGRCTRKERQVVEPLDSSASTLFAITMSPMHTLS